MRNHQRLAYLLPISAALLALFALGCSQNLQQAHSEIPSTDLTLTRSNTGVDDTDAIKRAPPIPPKQLAALDQMLDEISELAKTEESQAVGKLQVLFASSRENPKQYATAAEYAAGRVLSESQVEGIQIHAKTFLLMSQLQQNGPSQDFLTELARFACAYPQNPKPIGIYKNMADQLLTNDQGAVAIALLNHGIAHCKSCRDVSPLQRHKRMTIQTLTLMGRSAAPASLSQRSVAKAKPSKTDRSSKHYGMIGKRVHLAGRTLDGKTLSANQLRGKWVCVHFWATWCGACRSGMPGVVQDQKRFAKLGVEFVGVNMDPDQAKAKAYLKSQGINWPQLASTGKQGWDTPLAKSLGVKAIPTSVLIAPNGEVVEASTSGRMAGLISHQLGK